MSYAWSFHSFSIQKFQHYFGHASPQEVEEMVAAATWEEREYGENEDAADLEPIERAVRRVATGGISYAGLSTDDARTLDECIAVLFSPEGLEQQLEIGHESSDGVHPTIIEELLRRAEGHVELRYLPGLRHGWRYGATDLAVSCEYVLLHPEHLQPLADEVASVVALPLPWSEGYVPEIVDECLVQVLQAVIPQKKGLAGFLG
jgi:hypothetical protein